MEFCKEILTTSRLGQRDYIATISNLILGIVLSSVALGLNTREALHFRCNNVKKNASDENNDIVQKECHLRYSEHYDSPISIFLHINLNFFLPTAVCIIYSWCCVKTQVERVEEICKFDKENPQRTQKITTKRIYRWCVFQLFVRLIFRVSVLPITFLTDHLIPTDYPSEFSCRLKLKVVRRCINHLGLEKTALAYVVHGFNLFFMVYVFCELCYLKYATCKRPDFACDSEFCQKYLLRKRKVPLLFTEKLNILKVQMKEQTMFLEPLLPTVFDHNGKIYTEFRIRSKKDGKLIQLKDIFRDDNLRTILIIGQNGIGKSSLCTKLLSHWSEGELNCVQEFEHAFLFRFRHLNSKSMENISLKEFLGKAEHSIGELDDDTLQYILNNAEKILIIFDGLDEFECIDDSLDVERDYAGFNGVNDKIPVSALFVKLLQKKFLRGATVVTTTRPNTFDTVPSFIRFDKILEIERFQDNDVKDFVDKFCNESDSDKATWEQIQSNLNILEICKIPAICLIVCNFSNSCSFALKARFTKVYKEVLRMFILRHHPDFKTKLRARSFSCSLEQLFSSCPKLKIEKLASLAKKGLEDCRDVFDKKELDKYGLKANDLLVCLPRNDVLPYGYIAEPQYQFAFPYLQEFLAARCIVTEAQRGVLNPADYIKDKTSDADWHLVLQFVSGLIGMQSVSRRWERYKEAVQKTFNTVLQECFTGLEELSMKTALNTMKCFYELNDDGEISLGEIDRVASGHSVQQINFSNLKVSPVDCKVMADFLRRLPTPLELLNLSSNSTVRDSGLAELIRLIEEKSPKTLNISSCKITDKGLEDLMKATRKESSTLTCLIMGGNPDITESGIRELCSALKDVKFNVEILDLYGIELSKNSSEHICQTLQDSNCPLSELYVNLDEEFKTPSIKGNHSPTASSSPSHPCPCPPNSQPMNPIPKPFSEYRLFNAIVLSKLEVLGLRNNKITDNGLRLLCAIIEDSRCPLKKLYLIGNRITGKGLDELMKSLASQPDCKLEVLNLESNNITCADSDVRKRICDGLRHCKLSTLNLSRNGILPNNKRCLSKAEKPESLSLDM